MDRCPSQWVWGQTSSEFRSGGNSHCDLQQAGRQADSLSFRPGLKKRFWRSSHEGQVSKVQTQKRRCYIQIPYMYICVCERQMKRFSIGSDFAHRNIISQSVVHHNMNYTPFFSY
ncbi:hypothetical protein AMECASPLE_039511 [Ameca splendens]|uniref:Uncharacterized protein n=1 Tax=Ameca splendens TaxID=208324 RepID=A0ABV0ZVI4_9TELE